MDGQGGTATSVSDTINVSAPNAAPAAIYQTQRYGPMTYTIPGLTPGTSYTVRLHFAETWFGLGGRPGNGQRRFNVALNNANVLSNFDVFAAAGAGDAAVVRDFTVSASTSGQIVIALTNGSANYAMLNGIEVARVVQSAATSINAAGPALGSFAADTGYQGGIVSATSDAINVSAPNAAPAAVYQTQRYGPMTYTIPGFIGGGAYIVRLHFAELYWGVNGHGGGAGSRKFNVAINGVGALTNYDIYAAAGGPDKAVVVDIPSTADANGRFTISFTNGAADNAALNAIEIKPSAPASPTDVQAVNIGGPVVGTFVADSAPNGGSNGNIAGTRAAINVAAPNAAPLAVYQSQRWGQFVRVFSGLTPGATYTARLHFAEIFFGIGQPGMGQRKFNVAINGAPDLSDFDVYAAAGGANIAVVRDFVAVADNSGTITLSLTNGAANSPILNGVEIIAGATAGAVSPVIKSEVPHPSDALVDEIGINTHLSNYGTLYGDNFPMVKSLLQNAGIRHVRDGTPGNNGQLCNEEVSLASVGVHFNLLTDGNQYDLADGVNCLGAAVESIEGINEADISGQPNWVSGLRANTGAIAAQFPQMSIVAPALTSQGADLALGLMSNVSFGNAHAYFAGRNPGTGGWGGTDGYGTYGALSDNMNLAAIVSGTKPIDLTEGGYSDAVDQYAVPPVTKARYTLRTFLQAWNAGAARTYIYELIDEGTAPFSHYGIVDSAGRSKPVYVAISNFIRHLSDPGGAFGTTPLNYDFSAPSWVHHTLLQRRNGTYQLVFWSEVAEWDPNANAPITTTPQPVQLLFAKAPSAMQQTTFSDSGDVTSTSLPSSASVSLSASTWPTILDVTP